MVVSDLKNNTKISLAAGIPGRIRYKVKPLYKNSLFAKRLSNYLRNIDGVYKADTNIYSKSLLVIYDTKKISYSALEKKLYYFLNNYKKLSYENSKKTKRFISVSEDMSSTKPLSTNEFVKTKNILSKQWYESSINKLNPHYKALTIKTENVKNIKDKWHLMSSQQITDILNTDIKNGLSSKQAATILQQIGFNEFEKKQKKSLISMFLEQFDGFIIKLLLGASAVSAFLGQIGDAATIIVIVVVEAILGVWQNYKAEKSIEALKEYSASTSKVMRDGNLQKIPSKKLVPGDIIKLESGDIVPADCRLIESCELNVDEASLTGESEPVSKSHKVNYTSPVPLADRKNMVYMGTTVVKGTGMAVVVQTGSNTEMGTIAKMINNSKTELTPLQKDLERLAKFITWGCLGICCGIMVSGIIGGQPLFHMLRTGVSLAIGAIPEGLTTILTISLAFGVQRMAKRKAIIKKLPSVESLSCVDVICTDKTGTLTTGEMTVTDIYTLNKRFKITNERSSTNGKFMYNNTIIQPSKIKPLNKLLTISTLCNNASYNKKDDSTTEILGTPTEKALLSTVLKSDIKIEDFDCYTRVKEITFDSEIKKMTVVCTDELGKHTVNMKGAPDVVLSKCTKIFDGDNVRNLTQKDIDKLNESIDEMASRALRVIGFAYKDMAHYVDDDSVIESDLIFVGLAGIIDPPRPLVDTAIKKCKKAGVKVVMITGDHKKTAEAIGKEINLLDKGDIILTGQELDKLSDEELSKIINKVSIFARTSPHQKLRIVKALKQKGHIVAMTGDGVNDAPAIKESDVGIAMGQNGTNVTRESSSMILADDNFITIVSAIEEGRGISNNVKKFMRYVLSGNIGEVLAIFVASLMGLPTPLIASQILMVNLITEGIPALSLGVDPPDEDIMNDKPRDANKSIFDRGLSNKILARGFMMGVSTLLAYTTTYLLTGNLMRARTLAYANLVSCQMFHVFDCRTAPLAKNNYVLPSVAISSALLLATIYIPGLRGFFGTSPLNLVDWSFILFMSSYIGRLDYIKEQAAQLVKQKKTTSSPPAISY
ncbi:cation-translocating P-type ATPase [Caldisalinibacter kiritimatiensis]|uniref:P-type Ca(2+) transporter n=1 Tax=Caldisalinibacter kiritimatiensis TaxID=1304284 RepID=R1AS97_9FIRM|nr:HAD-IC family P-type ATPase [Caldisalinibacter kiritimatiensis]EOC99516.1 Lead, cadmium, zinc and mercury transporting ATPase / Copper-translocating P-type ATPase [Caldisalinibacter kiritimatiensis]